MPAESQLTRKLGADAVNKLADGLSQLVGEDIRNKLEILKNESGELVNEQGLPIIDIVEPVGDAESPTRDVLHSEETILPSLISLSPAEQDLWRRQRDYILDQLEEEERKEEASEEQKKLQIKQEMLRDATKEESRKKAAEKVQKRMGQALMRLAGESETPFSPLPEDHEKQPRTSKGKTVAFAGPQRNETETSSHTQWGDVTFARLRSHGPSVLSQGRRPMRDVVVERMHMAQHTSVSLPDSDDESEPEALYEDADQVCVDGSDTDNDQDVALEDEESDLDLIQHQREIASEYYEKRDRIDRAAWDAMVALEKGSGARVDVSLDVPVSIPEMPSISKFKASRLASAYGASALGLPALDASAFSTTSALALQTKIRMGKLDANGRLVGAEDDSENEEEGMVEMLDMLKKGELYNAEDGSAPELEPSSQFPPFNGQPLINRSKTSTFKASRPAAPQASNTMSANVLERKLSSGNTINPKTALESPPGKSTQALGSLPTVIRPPEKNVANTQFSQPPTLSNRQPAGSLNVDAAQKRMSRFKAERNS